MKRRAAHGSDHAFGHRTVCEADVSAFAASTGDYSRIHFDHALARETHGGPPIVHGLLQAAWAFGALTRHAPGPFGVGSSDRLPGAFTLRLRHPVSLGDTLAVRRRDGSEAGVVAFECVNQRDEITSTGTVSICAARALPTPPEAWTPATWTRPTTTEPFYAEDLMERGPRGDSARHTVTEADIATFVGLAGERNPLYLDASFAAEGPFGARIAPPLWTFCLGFAAFLDTLVQVPMPNTQLAGHVGDEWRLYRPVFVGDTLHTRHRPLSCTRSRSRPEMAIVEFGVQLLSQRDEVVQDGRVAMMVPGRPTRSP